MLTEDPVCLTVARALLDGLATWMLLDVGVGVAAVVAAYRVIVFVDGSKYVETNADARTSILSAVLPRNNSTISTPDFLRTRQFARSCVPTIFLVCLIMPGDFMLFRCLFCPGDLLSLTDAKRDTPLPACSWTRGC